MEINFNLFMKQNFNNLSLRPPLFYSWKYGIRFEICNPSVMEHEDTNNLKQIKERSTDIFNQVFQDTDDIFLITDVHCERNNTFLQKRPTNVYRKYIRSREVLNKLQHTVLPSQLWDECEEDFDDMVTHRFILRCKTSDIRYQPLLTAISYKDFWHPSRILKRNYSSGYDIYFVNITKRKIYHLYDDRGCDVIATNKDDLYPLYEIHSDWILDYDRDKINELFK
ncbi:DUF3885 domain-containing protein [Lederbergia lenta]|uniref:DUF3885 domain-containing protein n=1 Tax=Lederbergia lenta TaxID=1467 RepID=A0A2X4YZ86_LEDLE|nr:DUF3885 domain-containing protein [Lederbergia lenta]MEC2325824.1 DUF3885 domain-containing protein [Lederbergia lenta]SQI53694.1 Uncharacterised protein [Lederbergia lenta]